MRVVAGIVSWNAVELGRLDLARQAFGSLAACSELDEVVLLDNGSTDGRSRVQLGDVAGPSFVSRKYADGNHSPGRGCNELTALLLGMEPDIIVRSDDDMLWRPEAIARLRRFWAEAPADIVIACGYLEPDFAWNTPREIVEHGGERALVRDSAPGAAWSFRASDWGERVGPVLEDFGYDYAECCKLRERGLRVVQLDLSEHLGAERSTHGNNSSSKGKPLDEKWRLDR